MNGSSRMKNKAQFVTPGCPNPSIPIKQRKESTTKTEPTSHSTYSSFCSINSTKNTKQNFIKKNIAAVFDENGRRVDMEIPPISVLNNKEFSPIKLKIPNQRKLNENNQQSTDDEIDFLHLQEDFATNKIKKKHRRKLHKVKRNTYLTRKSSLFYNGIKKYNSNATSISTQTDLDITSEKEKIKNEETIAKVLWNKEFNEFCYQNQEIGDNQYVGKSYTEKPTSKLDEIRKPNRFYDIFIELKTANEDGTIRYVLSLVISFILLIWLISEVLDIQSPWHLLEKTTEYFSSLPIFAKKHKYAQEHTTADLAIQYFGNIMNKFFSPDKKGNGK